MADHMEDNNQSQLIELTRTATGNNNYNGLATAYQKILTPPTHPPGRDPPPAAVAYPGPAGKAPK